MSGITRRRKLFAPVLIIGVTILSSLSYAQTEWTKYEGNPVLDIGPPGTWEDRNISAPCVIKDGNIYKMWYEGQNSRRRVGYATSTDGVEWVKYAYNPVFSVSSNDIEEPFVIKDGETYKMWYERNRDIHYATSRNGIIWTNHGLVLSAAGGWEGGCLDYPVVIKDGETYKMWYRGGDQVPKAIGYATSPDGEDWTKYPGNPVLEVGDEGSWDDHHVQNPAVIKNGDLFEMWYTGVTTEPYYESIGYATSTDGINWTKHEGNPVLQGDPESWEDTAIHDPAVILDGDVYKMWYVGYDGSVRRIGYAESVMVTVPEDETPPKGAVHAHDNMIWPPNNKMVTVVLSGYVFDECCAKRDGQEIGVSAARLVITGIGEIILRDESVDLLNLDGSFSVEIKIQATADSLYFIELWASDTYPEEDGGPNAGLVDSTYIRVPHHLAR